ncbi:hypothetical protein QUF70_05130 [Desulfobacterales bacterium HSG17]|nr:hypothetical protein [Desulfobacterales bacterium HSG17]
MDEELDREKIMECGKLIENIILSGLDPEEIMPRFSIKDRLKGLTIEDRLKGLKPEEIDELENYLKELKEKKYI